MERQLIAAAASLAAACSHAPSPVACEGRCVADPIAHCVADTGCRDHRDCLAGLSCITFAALTPCGEPGIDDGHRCGPSTVEIDREVLVRDFEVDFLDVWLETAPEPRIAWTSPANARVIKCAVFTCPPQVAKVKSGGNPADESPDGDALRRIVNVPGCVHDIWPPSPPSRTSFAFPTTRTGANVATSECVADGEAFTHRSISMVAVGCWAFDDHRVLAVSELVTVPPALAQVFLPIRAGCGQFGETCYDEAGDFYGACADGECRPRCASAADCDVSLGAREPCAWRCAKIASSSVGVCVAR